MDQTDKLKESNLQKYKVIVRHEENVSKHEISRRLGMDRKSLSRIIDKFEEYGSVEIDLRHKNLDQPPIFDETSKTELVNLIEETEPMTFDEIGEEVKERMDIEPSTATLRRT